MNNAVQQIGLIGLGPHARRIYYPLIEKYTRSHHLNFVFLIELAESEDHVRDFLSDRPIQPQEIFFTTTNPPNYDLNLDLLQFLNGSIEKYKLDGVIIATEPKSHKAYLKWALEANIDVLIDKPITCPLHAANDRAAAKVIAQDFDDLEALYQASSSNVIVQAQRRSHLGYLHIFDYLTRILSEFQVPITHIEISHADGMWMMPNEWERENHSYKYGTGKLMHSGYHFVDLLAWFLQLNQLVKGQEPDELDMVVQHFSPSDFMQQLHPEHYQRLFQQDYSTDWEDSIDRLKQYGELDVFMLAQLKRQQSIVTTAALNLQQNSFSARAWSKLPADLYKGNGRIRHEQINIHVSMLVNIQVHSYQSYQINDPVLMEYGAGHLDHFDILIFRNSGLLGGKAFERIEIGRDFVSETGSNRHFSHNEMAREHLFLDFLKRVHSKSDFSQHRLTNQLLSQIYECIALERNGELPHLVCPFTIQ